MTKNQYFFCKKRFLTKAEGGRYNKSGIKLGLCILRTELTAQLRRAVKERIRMQPQKVNMFYLLKVLTEYSDEDHILTANGIIDLMHSEYGIKLERRAVYSYVNTLLFLGCDISSYDDNGKGYYLKRGYFDEKEVRMLIHGAYLNPECGRGELRELIKKLQKFLSVYKRVTYDPADRRLMPAVRTETADKLIRAAESGMHVELEYTEHGFENGRVCSSEAVCEADGADIELQDGAFFVYCSDGSGKRRRIGADRIRNVRLADGGAGKNRKETESAVVKVKCSECILEELTDDFGSAAHILTFKNGSFTAIIETDPESFEPWALKNIGHCEVIEPNALRNGIIDAIRASGYFGELCGGVAVGK